jgi:predicted transcriptional regulator
MDLDKVANMVSQTAALASEQQKVNQKQQEPVRPPEPQGDPAANSALNSLSQMLGAANNEPAPTDAKQAELQKMAAQLSARVNSLIAEANALEDQLNLAPSPDAVDVGELLAAFKDIIAQLTEDMNALQKKIEEQRAGNAMDLKQKPTAFQVGEEVGDASFNQTLSLQ